MDAGAQSYQKYLSGDDQGMAELIALYKDGLMLYLAGLTHDVFSAEELTEDTFFKLMVKKPRYRDSGRFKAWLYAIARNVCHDEWRRQSTLVALPEEQLGEVQSLEQSYLHEEDRIAVHRCMARLNPDYGQVLWLKEFEDFDNAQIARIMGKSRRQVEMLLYRAKASLKAELEKEGFCYENQ